MLYYSMPALAAGFILDLMIGDPRWLYHPVCLIGNLIAFLEKILRKIFPKTDKGELAAGTVEVILVCLLSGGIPFLILHILYGISVWAGFALETFWCYQLLATALLAALLGKYGYVANQVQNPAVLSIMRHSFTTIPGVLWIVTAIVLFFYRLNKKRYNEIVEDLKKNRVK